MQNTCTVRLLAQKGWSIIQFEPTENKQKSAPKWNYRIVTFPELRYAATRGFSATAKLLVSLNAPHDFR